MGLEFAWILFKARRNVRRHGVSFEEASTVFADQWSVTIHDAVHSLIEEERFITIGQSEGGRLLVVVHCDRGDTIRLISARPATPRERRTYEEG